MRISRLAAVGALSVVALAACGSDSDDSGAVDTEVPAAAVSTPSAAADDYPVAPADNAAATDGAGLQLLDTTLGSVLGESTGFTVYLFMPDAQGDSTCYDDCATTWPFVAEVDGVGDGLDESLLGTTERTTGEVQATYNGWPLYTFASDAAPGDTNGQGVGDVWYALDATGTAIEN